MASRRQPTLLDAGTAAPAFRLLQLEGGGEVSLAELLAGGSVLLAVLFIVFMVHETWMRWAILGLMIWGGWLRPFPSVAWLEPLNFVFPAVLFFGSGASCFLLLKRLKDPVQQKVLVGAAFLLMAVAIPFLIPGTNSASKIISFSTICLTI